MLPVLPVSHRIDYLFEVAETVSIEMMKERDCMILPVEAVADEVAKLLPDRPQGQHSMRAPGYLFRYMLDVLSLIAPTPRIEYRLKARTNRLLHDGTHVHLLNQKYWFPSPTSFIARSACRVRLPNHITRHVFDLTVNFQCIQGYWYNRKKEKGLLLTPLGQSIVEDYGCFATYLLERCKQYRPNWSEEDVKLYKKRLIGQILNILEKQVNHTTIVDMAYLTFYSFSHVPMIVDTELIYRLTESDAKFERDGLFLKRAGFRGFYVNPGEMDDEWNSLDPEEDVTDDVAKLGDDDILQSSIVSEETWE
ncbi:Oidioi.mRNA.OKI2018_I69.XSR.g13796.t1.cds [Oikopleura dioica]|uniref:Oidioi.mRNA.OKI2018_I69.XSR.g13796.t1.cds n=1 Tax=Oikopleura dioica TaxID=34765 RepID=A0ABN7S8E3_OIKDI|nr:Oidioi.mRNA.OKI2018_I69.XSR.g13796.t1.cds [Oikopleura dioica]